VDVLREGIEADLEQSNVLGASWAVIENGEINQTGSAGVVESGGPAAVTPDTLFQRPRSASRSPYLPCSDWSIAGCSTSTKT